MMRIKVGLTWAVGALLLAAGPSTAATQAVFVGIDRYANSHTHNAAADPGFVDLQDSVTDVALLKTALDARLKSGFDPGLGPDTSGCAWDNDVSTTLVDRCATRARIMAALAARLERAKQGDLVMFFFSGLGSSRNTGGGKSEGTLVPSDGRGVAGGAPDIALSELTDLQDRARRRGVRLFSVLEAAVPMGVFVCSHVDPGSGRDSRSLAPASESTDRSPSPAGSNLEGIVLSCDGNSSEITNYSRRIANLQDVLTDQLLQNLRTGSLPWMIRGPRRASGKPFFVLGGFSDGPTPKLLIYTPYRPGVGVTGGVPAAEGEAPWIVELRHVGRMKPGIPDTAVNRHACDGALIAGRWVLTAAHCLEDADGVIDRDWVARNLSVRMGSSNLDGPMHEFRIAKVVPHDDYCNPDVRPRDCVVVTNDIALLLLDNWPETVDRRHIATIEVAGLNSGLAPGTPVRIFGWGATSAENSALGMAEAHLRKADLAVVAPETCRSQADAATRAADANDDEFAEPLPDTLFCAGSADSKKDSCQGDSGGPVVTLARYGRVEVPTLVGVVSFGVSCAKAPGFYTKVSQFQPWMNLKMTIMEPTTQ